ncbi:MAG: VanZ family protein [Gammaproteobacteria bacterium]
MSAIAKEIEPPKLRLKWMWWLIGWLLILGTINESLQRKVWKIAEILPSDKAMHFSGYCILALWFAGVARRSRYLVVGLALIALGGSLEILQGVMHEGRTADWLDFLANSAGIVTGLGVAALGLGDWMVWIERLIRVRK